MIDKDRLTNHIKDIRLKQDVKKALGVCEQAIRSHSVRNTKFLTPNQISLISQIVSQIKDVSFYISGWSDEAERQIIYFFPEHMDFSEDREALSVVKLSWTSKEQNIGHRDCLGSILSLGIERDNIGDIIFVDDVVYIVLLKPLDIFLQSHLMKIKHTKVSVEIVQELPEQKFAYDELVINVSSFRLDAFVAELTRNSREKAQRLIQSGSVKLNFIETKDNSKQIPTDSVLSVRGFGKYRVKEFISETRKGRFRVRVLKYSN